MKTLALSAITFCVVLLSCGKPNTNEPAANSVSATAEIAAAPTPAPGVQRILFRNVRIFDGTSATLSAPSHVLVVGNTIDRISSEPIAADSATVIEGGGRTLMPGLIDAHTHIMFCSLSQTAILTGDIGFINVAAVKAANDMLLRGFTSIRDLGGPVFGLKRGIDAGIVPGPRIWPSGAFISQSGGHGDFRMPNDIPAQPGDYTFSERVGAAAIADATATKFISGTPQQKWQYQVMMSVLSVMRSVGTPLGFVLEDQPWVSATIWRTVADNTHRVYLFDSAMAPSTFWVKLDEMDLKPGAPVKKLELAGGKTYNGNATDKFVPAELFAFADLTDLYEAPKH